MRTTLSILSALAFVATVNADEPKRLEGTEAQDLMKRAHDAKEAGRYDEARQLAEKARGLAEKHRPSGGPNMPGDRKERAERFEKARHEIEELHRAGKHEEAEQLKRRLAGAMAEKHGGPPGKPGAPGPGADKERAERFEKARHQIEELNRAGKHEEAEHLKRRLAGAMAEKHDGPPGKPGEGPEKIRHLMEAIRHLREAGFNEPAENLEKMAHKMKEEFELRHKEFTEHARGPEGEGRRKEGPPPSPEAGSRRGGPPPEPSAETGPRRGGPPPAPSADASPRRDTPPGPGPDAGPRRKMPPAAGPEGGPSPRGELQAIREQVEKLSRAVGELRAEVNRRGNGGDRKEHEEIRRPRD